MSVVTFKTGFRYPENPQDLEPLNFEQLFGNQNPVEMEIGCGKGLFLVLCAEAFSEKNFLGIDIAGKWMRKGDQKREKRNLSNLQFMKVETRLFLHRIPSESISMFHVYFPDPWPKKRHHKRRIVNAEFLRALHKKLVAGGSVQIATDDRPYYLFMKEVLEEVSSEWSRVRETENERIMYPEFKTNYEMKWQQEGRNLYYIELVK